jgi:hypothetical protein
LPLFSISPFVLQTASLSELGCGFKVPAQAFLGCVTLAVSICHGPCLGLPFPICTMGIMLVVLAFKVFRVCREPQEWAGVPWWRQPPDSTGR